MYKALCLILLTAFLICKATDAASLLLAKDKAQVVCDSTCDNENGEETKKMIDDQLMATTHVPFCKITVLVILKTAFSYTPSCEIEIYKNLIPFPPELA